MKNVVLTRIDDRLIHGQVVTAWIKQTNGNRIVIVDDALSKDLFMQRVLRAAAPPQIRVEVCTIPSAIDLLKGDEAQDERLIILVKAPQVIEALMNAGIAIGQVNLGGMGCKDGRRKFYKNIWASEDEIACMKRIIERGSSIIAQLVPDERPFDIKAI